jgi:ABC-type glycerol-3-phosphate transport system substrate-binding protein
VTSTPTQVASTPEATISPTPIETGSLTPQGRATLRIWLPPEFDPEKAGMANGLLKSRLQAFETAHPDIRIEVRIKDLNGEGGLLESLAAASVSAPLTLPDLVLLPRPSLESAALKGLLVPLDGLTGMMEDRNWFSYAQQLAQLEATTYGIPFAGDAMVLAYKPTLTGSVPHTLDALVALGSVMLFPAADPQALFTLSLYMDGSGKIQDTLGLPFLDKSILTKTFEFEQRASQAGVMPPEVTQYSTDAQVWEVFSGDQSPMAVTWASTYLRNAQDLPDDLAMAPLPSWDGSPFSVANGWVWAFAGKDSVDQELSILLAEFLVEKGFMADWTAAAGFLPPRVDALQNWDDQALRQTIQQVSYSAQIMPPADLVSSLGPEIAQAVADVLSATLEPAAAAQVVSDQVNQP